MVQVHSLDAVGDGLAAGNAKWVFSGDVSKHFDVHVGKSVPFYHEGHKLVEGLSDFFLGDGSLCYEIGCSTGTLIALLAQHHAGKSARFVGIDIEPDMCAQARGRCDPLPNVEIIDADSTTYPFEQADLIIAYYTLQFVPPKYRQSLLNRLYCSLNWGGAIILFEKVRAPDARFQDIMTQLYLDYKIEMGYQAGEIIGKTRSLKGVLEPFSTRGNLELLSRAGFSDVMTVMKNVCFEGFLAIK